MSKPATSLSLLLSLKQRAVRAADQAELTFLIANETWHLISYQQALVFAPDVSGKEVLTTASGLSSLQGATPFTRWLGRVVKWLKKSGNTNEFRSITSKNLPEKLRKSWSEWWPDYALYAPLVIPGGKFTGEKVGFVIYTRDTEWSEQEIQLLGMLHESYAHSLNALRRQCPTISERLKRLRSRGLRFYMLLLAIGLVLAYPVRTSVIAPAEIIALDAKVVATPMDGVIKEFHVAPNQQVSKGELLFSLDDTTLRNRRDVAEKALSVANADALTAQQRAFEDFRSKAELATLTGRKKEKESEVAYLNELLGKTAVTASQDGIFIYTDPNDWIGRPVVTGERVAQLAQPTNYGVQVWLPVNDAINLESGSEIRVYLQIEPLTPLDASLIQTSYQATLSPEGISAYSIRGRLQGDPEIARIGLRGVAKLYGKRRPLIYSLLRRPLGTLRQWAGF
jgi:hypothetical protein